MAPSWPALERLARNTTGSSPTEKTVSVVGTAVPVMGSLPPGRAKAAGVANEPLYELTMLAPIGPGPKPRQLHWLVPVQAEIGANRRCVAKNASSGVMSVIPVLTDALATAAKTSEGIWASSQVVRCPATHP